MKVEKANLVKNLLNENQCSNERAVVIMRNLNMHLDQKSQSIKESKQIKLRRFRIKKSSNQN